MSSMNRLSTTRCTSLLSVLLLSISATAQSNKYACVESNPAASCTPANTCGSATTACVVNVKRTANSASATPYLPNAKGNQLFCVKAGTKVVWQSVSKDIGFVVDIGPVSPLVPGGTIIGGSDKSVTAAAKTPGCYKYSVGACMSGAIYGMCQETNAELVIVP